MEKTNWTFAWGAPWPGTPAGSAPSAIDPKAAPPIAETTDTSANNVTGGGLFGLGAPVTVEKEKT